MKHARPPCAMRQRDNTEWKESRPAMNEDDRLLTAEDLANFLNVPIKTLYAWRYRGEGPIGFRVGKHIRYRWTDVEGWIRDRVRVTEMSRRQDRVGARNRVGDGR